MSSIVSLSFKLSFYWTSLSFKLRIRIIRRDQCWGPKFSPGLFLSTVQFHAFWQLSRGHHGSIKKIHCLKFFTLQPLPLPASGQNCSFYCLYSFTFSRMSNIWIHVVYSLYRLSFLTYQFAFQVLLYLFMTWYYHFFWSETGPIAWIYHRVDAFIYWKASWLFQYKQSWLSHIEICDQYFVYIWLSK